jgi:hypothetical protein
MKRIALLAVLSLMTVACTQDEVTATLGGLVNAAVAAADIALPQDAVILNAVTAQCIDPALTTLEGTATGAAKSVAILAACAPSLASLGNTPALQAVGGAMNAFLNSVKGLTAEKSSTPEYADAFFGSTSAAKIDQKKLKELRKKVEVLKRKLAAKK